MILAYSVNSCHYDKKKHLELSEKNQKYDYRQKQLSHVKIEKICDFLILLLVCEFIPPAAACVGGEDRR